LRRAFTDVFSVNKKKTVFFLLHQQQLKLPECGIAQKFALLPRNFIPPLRNYYALTPHIHKMGAFSLVLVLKGVSELTE
jgi:hypothetical protein